MCVVVMVMQVLTAQMIRMEFVENAAHEFNDLATFVFVNRKVPCVPFTHTVSPKRVTIDTEFIHLEYTGGSSLHLEWCLFHVCARVCVCVFVCI